MSVPVAKTAQPAFRWPECKQAEKQVQLVLSAIRAGAKVVNPKYLGDVLCLAARGVLTAEERQSLILPSGRAVFAESPQALAGGQQ